MGRAVFDEVCGRKLDLEEKNSTEIVNSAPGRSAPVRSQFRLRCDIRFPAFVFYDSLGDSLTFTEYEKGSPQNNVCLQNDLAAQPAAKTNMDPHNPRNPHDPQWQHPHGDRPSQRIGLFTLDELFKRLQEEKAKNAALHKSTSEHKKKHGN